MLEPVASSWVTDVVGAVLDDFTISVGSVMMVKEEAARQCADGRRQCCHRLRQCGVSTRRFRRVFKLYYLHNDSDKYKV